MPPCFTGTTSEGAGFVAGNEPSSRGLVTVLGTEGQCPRSAGLEWSQASPFSEVGGLLSQSVQASVEKLLVKQTGRELPRSQVHPPDSKEAACVNQHGAH